MQACQWDGPLQTFDLGPTEELDFAMNWGCPAPPLGVGSWLAPGETIVGTPTVAYTGPDTTLTVNPSPNGTLVSGGLVVWWLSTPTVGSIYLVSVSIVTNQGRRSTRSIKIIGVQR